MTVLTDFSSEAIDNAVEKNFLYAMNEFKELEGIEYYTGNDMTRIVCPDVPHPMVNMIMQTHLDGDINATIQQAMATYTSRNIPFLWQIEASTHPANLGDKLIENGIQSLGASPILVADLDSMSEQMKPRSDFEIRRVSNTNLLKASNDLMQEGFALPKVVTDKFDEVFQLVGFDEGASIQSYVGFLNGEPVSNGSIFYFGGVAGFYNGMVLESARNKGIGTANALHRINEAKAKGYRIGFMVSGGNAYNLYKRLGFKDYSPWQRYVWMPATGESTPK